MGRAHGGGILHVAKISLYFSKPRLFVKALCGTHMKDYYTVHFKYFVVSLLSDFCLVLDGKLPHPTPVEGQRGRHGGQFTVRETSSGAERDSIPELEGLETLPLETGSSNNSKD